MTREQALEKVRKVLALAGGTDNRDEAAAALARAHAIMERYNIAAAEARGGALEDVVKNNIEALGRWPAWRIGLANAMADAFGCLAVWSGKRWMMFVGQQVDVEAAKLSYAQCIVAVDRLTALHARGRGRSFANGFRMGCVEAVARAVRDEKRRSLAEAEGTSRALVLVDQRQQRAKDAIGKLKNEKRTPTVHGEGYAHGYIHGKDIYNGLRPKVKG